MAAAAVVTGAALTATYLQDQRDPTLILAAFGAGGMPIVSQWVPTHCHAPTRNSSAIRLDRKELLALLEKK